MACESPFVCPETIQCLLRHGVDPTGPNLDGRTPLHALCENRELSNQQTLEVVQALMAGLPAREQCVILKSRTRQSRSTPLDFARREGQFLVIRWLEELEAQLFKTSGTGLLGL
ncbi:uncharacterized protein B0I36DRAFT_334290 [Microdochium trichocladiopsis]|uniref:Ankyrin repeat-containing domain protein n=1 Tax=Microdochium trichocladiopsis TaxID=1682393 RepID=A0A9P9BI92_9PEZI|nr:uncharacterized protein B0I36DRAFT_334290 [Microdochium trichocladiopsis]KAH7021340.1 hypothetical protein B0I36DRAFT_334290 [Microdochium trichocladiopsis]